MPRCSILGRRPTDEEFAAFTDGPMVVPVERKADSFGWLDGRLVALDYGS
jgi:hypothetical protein